MVRKLTVVEQKTIKKMEELRNKLISEGVDLSLYLNMAESEPLLAINEAAAMVNRSKQTLYNRVSLNKLRAFKQGNDLKFRPSDLYDAFKAKAKK